MGIENRDIVRAAKTVELLLKVENAVARGRTADRELARIFRQNRGFGSHDRRIYSSSAFSLFRWRGWCGTLQDQGVEALLKALMLDTEEMSAMASALAETAGIDPLALEAMAALGLDEKAERLKVLDQRQAIPDCKELVPEWVWPDLPVDDEDWGHAWVESVQSPLPVWLRLDRLQREQSLAFLAERGVDCAPHPTLPCALESARNISRAILDAPQGRGIEIQDLASQAVGFVCAPAAGEKWWDACAGAGGKSLQLADLMENRGSILASDIRPQTLRELRRRMSRSNASIIGLQKLDAAGEVPAHEEFDGVLVDAPCSGVGTWARHPDARWRTDSAFVEKCSQRQLALLANAAHAVKPDGRLVYAVCSPLKSETDLVVDRFLEENTQFKPAPFSNPLDKSDCDGRLLIDQRCAPATIAMFIARFVRRP